MWSPTESSSNVTADALTIGPVASRLLGGWRNGSVHAVFAQVVYLSLDGGLLTIARTGIEAGPLTVQTDIPSGVDLRGAGIAPRDRVRCAHEQIRIGDRWWISLGRCRTWSPEPMPVEPSRQTVMRGLKAIRTWVPTDTLGRTLDDPGSERLVEITAAAITDAGAWISAGAKGEPSWAVPLVGLGPGLTPSGDDFLGGAMIALHAIGQARAAQRIWATICPSVSGTTPVSQALLSAAAEGVGSASVHQLLAALLSGDAIYPALGRLLRIGHSSGQDTLAGIVCVLVAGLQTKTRCLDAQADRIDVPWQL